MDKKRQEVVDLIDSNEMRALVVFDDKEAIQIVVRNLNQRTIIQMVRELVRSPLFEDIDRQAFLQILMMECRMDQERGGAEGFEHLKE